MYYSKREVLQYVYSPCTREGEIQAGKVHIFGKHAKNWRCTVKIKTRIAIMKEAFEKEKRLFCKHTNLNFNKETHVTFIDFEKAFYRVHSTILWQVLKWKKIK